MMKKIHLKLLLKLINDGSLNLVLIERHISQAQSINVFVPADIHKKELHNIHFQAWKKGLKEPLLL